MKPLSQVFDPWKVISIFLVALMALFIVYPLVALFASSFQSSTGEFTLGNFILFFSKKYYLSALANSLLVSATATFFAVVLGSALAIFLSRYVIPGKKVLDILIVVVMISPPFIGAYSWILLLGRNGLIVNFFAQWGIDFPDIYGFLGIVLVFVFKLFPFIYLYVSGALKRIDTSLEEASESLGMTKFRRMTTVTLPVIVPTLLAGALMVFMNSLADFGTPMLIGEGFRVMPVIIYNEYVGEMGGNASFAGAVSVVVVFIATLVFGLQKYVVNRRNYVMSALRPPQEEKIKGIKRFFAYGFCYLVVFIGILPQITVVVTSFLKTKGPVFLAEFGVESYLEVLTNLQRPLINTFVFGLFSLAIIIVFGVVHSYLVVRKRSWLTRLLDNLVMFPYIIPGSVLGVSLLLAFNKDPLILSGTAAIMIAAFVIRRVPYTIRSSSAILYQLDPQLEEASVSLGRSPVQTFFRVTVPLMLPGVISGGILSWITATNELSASVFLYTGMTVTMSVATYTDVVRASYGTAAATSAILTFVTILSLVLFYRFSQSKEVSV